MRKVADVRDGRSYAKRVILYACPDGVYVFPCSSLEDGSSTGDKWYASVEKALAACEREFGITAADWRDIPDPLPGCLHDWIGPTRVKQQSTAGSQQVVLEQLGSDGVWREVSGP